MNGQTSENHFFWEKIKMKKARIEIPLTMTCRTAPHLLIWSFRDKIVKLTLCIIMHNLVHAQESCACTRILCMHKNLVHAQDHLRKLCKLVCFLTCVLQKVVKTEAKLVKPSPSTAPAQKKYSGTIKVETGTAQRCWVEPGKETSLEPLKHSLFGEYPVKVSPTPT